MTGDYTRYTFRPEEQFSGVRLQQGRVQIDADWNEAVDIALHRGRAALRDIVGPTGVPDDASGFQLSPITAVPAADLAIGPGRAYVGGVLVEYVGAGGTTLEKVSGSGANTVWKVIDGPRLAAGQWVGPASSPLSNLTIVAEILAPQDGDGGVQRLKLAKGIGGGKQVVAALATYRAQPNLPDPPPVQEPGPYLAYLDVWEREITALEDPALKDVALGGPDTALRTRVIWQVKLLALQPLIDARDLPAPPVCKSFGPSWSPDNDVARASLAVRTSPAEETPDPCVLPSAGGYRSLENRLYRAEVHVGGTAGQDKVFIKWSRDNAIHRSRLLNIEEGSLVVEETGKDAVTAFKPGEWLEVLDESRILRGEAGFFVELGEVVGTRLGIKTILDPLTLQPLTQNNEPNTDVLPKTGLVRRWEGGPPAESKTGEWLAFENGIEVQIGAGLAHVGDHWLIPARSLTASIEWPLDEGSGEPEFLPALGIAHRHMPLAIVELAADSTWAISSDCRPVFPPLTRLESFLYLGGDGQEAMPDLVGAGRGKLVALDQPFRTGVARGRAPVKGRLVRFRVTDASEAGRLERAAGTDPADVVSDTGVELIVRTGEAGVANAQFSLDRRRHIHHVLAELLDTSDPPQAASVHPPIHFTASTSVAAEVAYDPATCPDLRAAGANTVQQAIDALCKRPSGRGGCCVTVGDRGEFPTLDIAIVNLVEAGERDLCLCLLAGDHKLEGPLEREDPDVRIAIHGCGAEVTRLHLSEGRALLAAEAIAIEDLGIEIEAEEGGLDLVAEVLELSGLAIDGPPKGSLQPLLRLDGARELRLADSRIVAASAERTESLITSLGPLSAVLGDALQPAPRAEFRERARAAAREIEALSASERKELSAGIAALSQRDGLRSAERLAIGELARAVEAGSLALAAIDRLRLAAVEAQPGPALLIRSMRADTRIERNEIWGKVTMSLLGEPDEGRFEDVDWGSLVELAKEVELVIAGTSTLRLERNRLGSFTVDAKTMGQLAELADGGGAKIAEVFASAIVSGNVFTGRPLVVLAERHACDHNRFEIDEDAGALVGQTATCLGNWAHNDFRLFAATREIVPHDEPLRSSLNANLNIVHWTP